MPNILIIDDDVNICETFESLLSRLHYDCATAQTISQGFKLLREHEFDVLFLDVRLPDGNGLDCLSDIAHFDNPPEVIILTGDGDPAGAEIAIQRGVWDYLVKPASIKEITQTLKRVLKYRQEKLDKSCDAKPLEVAHMVGTSSIIRSCFSLMAQAASTDANVLITGETGTGKELTARTIHTNSTRSQGEFVVVDCAALTESLLESTLFGHKKGAFTGADTDKDGLVKLADNGTLFLDEVGEMPLTIQKSFLRFLQERVFRPVGGTAEEKSNFRLVSATNRNLETMVEDGDFRQDLLFRLKTVHIELPALRLRNDDLELLSQFRIKQLCKQYGMPVKNFSADFFPILAKYDWPGNVRELFNALEQALVAAGSESVLYARHLPADIRIKIAQASLVRGMENQTTNATKASVSEKSDQKNAAPVSFSFEMLPTLRQFKSDMEKKYLLQLIAQHGSNIHGMLETSGLSRSHLYALLKKYNISL
ncbi:sigma-54 dependent transcriptional regulator [Halodesulfovibrio sp. MK-HDV]|jgi:two-component system, NtrC family, response regulator|uniref:sigma-54-dependent transcriptional regulator n=1 Tax=unclassified Halodesulfovibrio TaxID=2644657 RepID=UPI0013691603|nr:sigma-54 dependent transcriptional regulator [Halodesulfovibrio sp. MK-HDV]KAF1077311.1 Regulatory protein AtoC [Halodesulfovibrio sp. MK-HDV]